MSKAGHVVLFEFPRTNLQRGKLRPALVLCELPGQFDDWLICMISSQLRQAVSGFDEIMGPDDPEFSQSGLKTASVIRLGRIAVVEGAMLAGSIGEISEKRLIRVKTRLAGWLAGEI